VLSLSCEAMPVFKNLTTLNIRTVMQQGWQAMPLLQELSKFGNSVPWGIKHQNIFLSFPALDFGNRL